MRAIHAACRQLSLYSLEDIIVQLIQSSRYGTHKGVSEIYFTPGLYLLSMVGVKAGSFGTYIYIYITWLCLCFKPNNQMYITAIWQRRAMQLSSNRQTLIIECVDFNHVRRRFYQVPSLQHLFPTVKPEVILHFFC